MARTMVEKEQPRSGRTPPIRRCLATGERRPQEELLRFVVDPQGGLVADFAGRLPGHGLWITPTRDIVALALRKGLFSRAAKRPLALPDDLLEKLGQQARRRALDALGLARRAGLVANGFDAVRAWLQAGRAAFLLEASDGSPEGLRKLGVAARRGGRQPPVLRLFSAAELGQALGRPQCVHVALAPGGMTDRFRAAAERTAALQGLADDLWIAGA